MRVDNRRFAWVWLAALALCVQLLISVPFAFAADGACAYLLAPGSSEWSSVGLDSPDASAVGCRGYAQDIEDIGTSILIAGSLDIDTITACDGGSCFHASFALAAVNRTNYWQTYPFFSRDASVNRVLAADRVLVVAGAFTGQTASTTYNNIALISKYESFSAQIDPIEGGVDGEVFAIAQLDDLLFVAGAFSRAALARPQPLPRNGGAVWNRTQGAWVEGVMPPSPTVLTAHGRVLWAASSEGGVSRLYGWDGSAWQRRCGTDDVYGQVFAVDFAPDRDFVFIGGDFTAVGALPVARLAMWDGQRWRSMGGGVRYGLWTPAVIFDVEVNGTDVYVGGRFSTAGNGSFNSLARYDTLTDQFYEVAGGFYGVVRIIEVATSGLLVGVYPYSRPASSASAVLAEVFFAGGVFVLVLAGLLVATLIVLRVRAASLPERAMQLRHSLSVLLVYVCVLLAYSVANPVANVMQIALLPGVGLQRAEWLVSVLSGVQWTVSALAALLFAWAARRFSIRLLYSLALCLSVLGTACYAFMTREALVWISTLATGILFGAVVGITLTYFSKSLDSGHIVLPLLLFFFSLNVFPALLSSLVDSLIDLGLVRLDLVYHAMFYLILSCLLLLGMAVGFAPMGPGPGRPGSPLHAPLAGRSPGASLDSTSGDAQAPVSPVVGDADSGIQAVRLRLADDSRGSAADALTPSGRAGGDRDSGGACGSLCGTKIPWGPLLFVLVWFLAMRCLGWSQSHPRYFTVSTITRMAFSCIGFALAVVLLVAFYWPSRRFGVSLSHMVLFASSLQTIGYVVMIVCLLVPFSMDRMRALEYSFYLGNRVAYSSSILMYALCTVLFISVVNDASLPLEIWIGVYSATAIVGTGVGESIRKYFLDPHEFDPMPQAILFLAFMVVALVFALVFVCNSRRFVRFTVLLAGSGMEDQMPLMMKKSEA